jgi:hypothetical protein
MIASWNLFFGKILTCVCANNCRIRVSVSISGSANTELPAHGIFPLHVLFASATSNDSLDGVSTYFGSWKIVVCVYSLSDGIFFLIWSFKLQHSPVYRFRRACLLTSFSESGDSDHTKATFIIPDLKSLATSQVCNLNIILISCGIVCILCDYLSITFLCCHQMWFHFLFISKGQRGQNLSGTFSENHMDYSSPQSKLWLTLRGRHSTVDKYICSLYWGWYICSSQTQILYRTGC